MDFYAIFFWLSTGYILGFGSMLAYSIWWWRKAAKKGIVAIRGKDDKWLYKNRKTECL